MMNKRSDIPIDPRYKSGISTRRGNGQENESKPGSK